ncbi:unnamed protein product [Ilex paraguariensis]|uniref:Uncharacterized protein n=1 Tax=Ilex paraguariensis TaxID=185542 RepID=A0ABC8UB98_9AQUA
MAVLMHSKEYGSGEGIGLDFETEKEKTEGHLNNKESGLHRKKNHRKQSLLTKEAGGIGLDKTGPFTTVRDIAA